MATKSTAKKNTSNKPATKPLPPIDERAVRSLDMGEPFDDELDPLGMAGADGARPPNRYEARPPNRYEARPPNRYEHRAAVID
jgi:hypothetical protein